MATNYGYAHGQPFGDPSGFTASTQDSEIDRFNQWMRSQPWWESAKAKGPEGVKDALTQVGIPVEDDFNIDDAGNLHKGSWWDRHGKQVLEGAAIGGLALTGLGAAGIGPLSSMFGAGAAAGDLGAEGVVEGAGLPVGTEVASEDALGGLAGLGPEGVAETAGLPAGTVSAGEDVVGGGAMKGGGLLNRIGNAMGVAGKGVGAATQAAGQNRLDQERLALEANRENIEGMSASERALLDRSKLEEEQRRDALKNIYRQSHVTHPRVSPFDPVGAPTYSSEYMKALGDLTKQGGDILSKPMSTDVSKMAPITPYKPIDIANVPSATGTKKGVGETIGDYVSPTLSAFGAFAKPNADSFNFADIMKMFGG